MHVLWQCGAASGCSSVAAHEVLLLGCRRLRVPQLAHQLHLLHKQVEVVLVPAWSMGSKQVGVSVCAHRVPMSCLNSTARHTIQKYAAQLLKAGTS
jgi:hypothetical protein